MESFKKYLSIIETKHTLSSNRLDFPGDEDVVEVILTRTDPHDLAKLIASYAVLCTYMDMSKEKTKHDDYNSSADPEDKEELYDFSIKEFASRASDDAYDIARQVRERVLDMKDADYIDIIKHFFPDHEKTAS